MATGVVATALFSLAGLRYVERYRLGAIDPEYASRLSLLQNQLAQHHDRPLLLVVGSSRVMSDFVPEQLPPIFDTDGRQIVPFNFGHTAAGPITNYMILSRLMRAGIKPDYVVIETMPCFLAGEDDGPLRNICTSDDIFVVSKFLPSSFIWDFVRWRLSITSKLLSSIANSSRQSCDCRSLGGYIALKELTTDSERNKLIHLQSEHYKERLDIFHTTSGAELALIATVKLCKDNRVRVAFLMTPEGDDFRSLYGDGSEERYACYVRELGQKLQVAVIDARRWLAEDDFLDSHHALKRGAEVFTKKLNSDGLQHLLDVNHPHQRNEPGVER